MYGVKEEQGAYAFVEVVAAPAETVESLAFTEQVFQRRRARKRIE
jgi:hypothetical protein